MTEIPKEVLEMAAIMRQTPKVLDIQERSKSILPDILRIANVNDKGAQGVTIDFELSGSRFVQTTLPRDVLMQLISIAQLQQMVGQKQRN